jgi:hypothetical protein
MSKIEVDAIDKQSGSTLTLGGSGTAVTLACGATQSGFGRTGTVDWQTSIKTTSFTAASGEGYFCDTATTGAFTLTLPSSPSVGDIVALKDYAGNFATANLTIGRGGSNLNGDAQDSVRDTDNESLTLVYADATKGWLAVEEGTGYIGESFVTATGGTVTCSGNCRIHTFTGPGTFTVTKVASCAANNIMSHLVLAGGASGGCGRLSNTCSSGGGGAGGFREVKNPVTPYTASPLDGYPTAPNRITVTAQGYPITVGAGGASAASTVSNNGSPSTFSTITSTGGGGGGSGGASQGPPNTVGSPGGSGGGIGGGCGAGGTGNTPPVTPPQGNNGGSGSPANGFGGGGGATAVGGTGTGPTASKAGGAGATTSITASPVAYAGGGGAGGSLNSPTGGPGGSGGGGGGGNHPSASPSSPKPGTAGTTNRGGGGGGMGSNCTSATSGAGGSGIVIIRYKFQ